MLVPGAVIAATVGRAVGTTAAQAYGTDHVYQLTFSLNWDNRASQLCAPDMFGLGGVWGWIEPDSDGTADATITFCAQPGRQRRLPPGMIQTGPCEVPLRY
jgi:hypothetical protein